MQADDLDLRRAGYKTDASLTEKIHSSASIFLDTSVRTFLGLRRSTIRAIRSFGEALVEITPDAKIRGYPLGFWQPAVPAGATVIVTARAQIKYKPRRVLIPLQMCGEDIAPNFSILDIRIGINSQLVSAEELPATIFSERSIDANLDLDIAKIGQDISFTIRNLDIKNAHDFRATMFGTSLE